MDVIKVSKTFEAPLSYVYDWLTDFSDDDPKLTGSKRQRKILYKTKEKVVYTQLYKGVDGKQKIAVDVVALHPPSSWHLDFFGEEDTETGEYRLKSLGDSRTRLDMVFKEKWKIANPPSLAAQVKSTSTVWDKYVAALEKEYNSKKR